MNDPKDSVKEKEPHLTSVVCLEQSAGIPGDGEDRTGAALGESKFDVGHEELLCLEGDTSVVI